MPFSYVSEQVLKIADLLVLVFLSIIGYGQKDYSVFSSRCQSKQLFTVEVCYGDY